MTTRSTRLFSNFRNKMRTSLKLQETLRISFEKNLRTKKNINLMKILMTKNGYKMLLVYVEPTKYKNNQSTKLKIEERSIEGEITQTKGFIIKDKVLAFKSIIGTHLIIGFHDGKYLKIDLSDIDKRANIIKEYKAKKAGNTCEIYTEDMFCILIDPNTLIGPNDFYMIANGEVKHATNKIEIKFNPQKYCYEKCSDLARTYPSDRYPTYCGAYLQKDDDMYIYNYYGNVLVMKFDNELQDLVPVSIYRGCLEDKIRGDSYFSIHMDTIYCTKLTKIITLK